MPARKGRGAVGNVEGRFETRRLRPEDYGWGAGGDEDAPPRLDTTVTPEKTRTILSRNDSPDIPFDRSINPYKGCEHGCVYCFARPTHSYLGMSPGLDFETKIFSKPDAARLLREELRRPGYRCDVIALGANTDPYQPVERDLNITRAVLEVLWEHRQPVGSGQVVDPEREGRVAQLDRQRERVVEPNEDRKLKHHRQAAGKRVHMMPAVEFHDLLLERELVVLEALPKLGHLWLNLLHFSHVTECRPG